MSLLPARIGKVVLAESTQYIGLLLFGMPGVALVGDLNYLKSCH